MDQRVLNIIRTMKNYYCEGCDLYRECRKDDDYNCGTKQLMNEIANLEFADQIAEEEGCFICDSGKDIFFEDGRGGFRIADFCPHCGRKLS